MYTISKEFTFSASHALKGLPAEHPCTRMHGHNYIIKVELKNVTTNHIGFVVDYRELAIIKQWIDAELDHQNLNEVLPFNPTAENIAEYLYGVFKKVLWAVSAVEVSETEKTNARYEP